MKKTSLFLVVLLVAVQTLTISARPAYGSYKSVSIKSFTGINAKLITSDLVSQGYTVYSVVQVEGSTTWIAHTSKNGVNYQTTVYTDGVTINGSEDSPL